MFDTERFIAEIERQECIWNIDCAEYHVRSNKSRAWIEVFNATSAENFDTLSPAEQKKKIDDLQKKWKNIRDHFKKHRKVGNTRPYIYSNMLEFLRPVLKDKKSESSMENPTGEDSDIDDTEEVEEPAVDPLSEDTPKRQASPSFGGPTPKRGPSSLPPKSNKKVTASERTELLEEKMLERLCERQEEEEDGDKLFLLSLLPQIRQLNVDQKNQLYFEFLQCVQKAKHFATVPNGQYPMPNTNPHQNYQIPFSFHIQTQFPPTSYFNTSSTSNQPSPT